MDVLRLLATMFDFAIRQYEELLFTRLHQYALSTKVNSSWQGTVCELSDTPMSQNTKNTDFVLGFQVSC